MSPHVAILSSSSFNSKHSLCSHQIHFGTHLVLKLMTFLFRSSSKKIHSIRINKYKYGIYIFSFVFWIYYKNNDKLLQIISLFFGLVLLSFFTHNKRIEKKIEISAINYRTDWRHYMLKVFFFLPRDSIECRMDK